MAVKIDYSPVGDIVSFTNLDSEPYDPLDLVTEMPAASMILWSHPQSQQWVLIECLNWGATPISAWVRRLAPYVTLTTALQKVIQEMQQRGISEWKSSDSLSGYRQALLS